MNRYMLGKVLYLLLLLGLGFTQVKAQIPRYEFNVDGESGVGDLHIFTDALILPVFEDYSKREHHPERKYVVLDKHLKEVATRSVEPNFRHKFIGSYETQEALFELFYDYRLGDYTLIEIQTDGSVATQTGKLPARMFDPSFMVHQEAIWLVNHTPQREQVVIFSLEDASVQTFDASPKLKHSRVHDLVFKVLPESGNVVFAWQEEARNEVNTHVATYSDDGALEDEHTIPTPNGIQIQSLDIVENEDGDHMISGTYGKPFTKKSSGVFFSILQDGSQVHFSHTPFTKFAHFFDYMSAREKEDFKRKMKRLERHEKSTDVGLMTNQHPLIYADGSYFLTVEVYEETYRDEYGVTRNGNTIAGSPQQLTGYFFSHATVVRFDAFGELLHDSYVPLRLGQNPLKLSEQIRIQQSQDTLLLAYSAKNHTYRGNLKPRAFLTMEKDTSLTNRNPEITSQQRQFEFWQVPSSDQTYISHGFETRVTKSRLKRKENIYFIELRKLH